MSLLKPTRGEILDRLSILQRRLVERQMVLLEPRGASEITDLVNYLHSDETAQEQLSKAGLLAAINGALWERENLLRKEGISDTELAAVVKETSRLNDWRAETIAWLDGSPSSAKIHRS